MAIRTILHYPNPELLKVGEQVVHFDDELNQLIDDMIETMYHADGVGLAATQIGVHLQLAVIDHARDGQEPLVVINPKILNQSGQLREPEGCLSVRGAYDTVTRSAQIKIQALNRAGKPYELDATGRLAHVIQHEYDHLQGKLFIHRLSTLKRQLTEKKIKSAKRL
jgi:peptide deformylase